MLFSWIFARTEAKPLPNYVLRHEEIHRVQAKEVGGYLVFYAMYLWQVIRYGYREAPFEQEAYQAQNRSSYLWHREKKAWKDFLKRCM